LIFVPFFLAVTMEMTPVHPHPVATDVTRLKKPVETYFHNQNVALARKVFAHYAISANGQQLYVTFRKAEWNALPEATRISTEAKLHSWWRTVCLGKRDRCTTYVSDDATTMLFGTTPAPKPSATLKR
jgi:hypothetical protein